MNLRSLCFSRVARARNSSWLWWDFVDRLGDECRMADKKFTPECAQGVFDAVVSSSSSSSSAPDKGDKGAMAGPDARREWLECSDVGGAGEAAPLDVLEQELKSQTGGGGGAAASAVAILPTVRVNGKQYRGSFEAGGVLRALCAAFPAGAEPAVCNEAWVSEDECEEGGEGWRACNNGCVRPLHASFARASAVCSVCLLFGG